MDPFPTVETRGAVAPADGNAAAGAASGGTRTDMVGSPADQDARLQAGATTDLGPNFERLEELRPKLVNALRELVRQYRQEGVVARRHEIRRIRQARLF